MTASRLPLSAPALAWLLLAGATAVLAQTGGTLAKALDARWLMKVPREIRFPVKDDISAFMAWLVEDANFGLFTFTDLTRGIAWLLEQPYELARALLVDGFVQGLGNEAVEWLPPLSWIAVIFVVAAIGHYAKSFRLAVFVGLCFLYLAVFGSGTAPLSPWRRSS
jgi:glycine betaine/proline transport system permease protein